MESNIVELNLIQFSLIYVLLIIVAIIMKISKVNQTKLLVVASVRMSVQLVIAGFVLTYIFENPQWYWTLAYIFAMAAFSIGRTLLRNPWMNKKFKMIVVLSLGLSGVLVLLFFVLAVIGVNFFNPQYTIPIAGMIFGNSMTGVTLGLKSFKDNLTGQKERIEALVNIGTKPKTVLKPFANSALETALLPTMNSMLGMGIIALPGMMTGQILSGTMPMTAILYQIAIVICICAVVCIASFCTLNFGYRTLYNKKNQMII